MGVSRIGTAGGDRVAVVGAGPAGSVAALTLARGGMPVDLYRPARPGEKPCGGGVPVSFLPAIEGFCWRSLERVSVSAARLETEHGIATELGLSGLSIFRRRDFDAALELAARQAGAVVHEAKVEAIEASPRGIRVAAEGRSRSYAWVIGSDGARGRSRRLTGVPPGEESVAIGATLEGVQFDRIVLSFPGLGDCYAWIFPRPGGVSVGIAFSADRLSQGAATRLLNQSIEHHLGFRGLASAPAGHRYRYPIPLWCESTLIAVRRGSLRRVALVGDAAGVGDPLTREGIRWAIRSAQIAATCLLEGCPEHYAGRLADTLGPELGRARRARQPFFEGGGALGMVALARIHRPIRRVVEELLTCRQGYCGLRQRLFRALVYRDAGGASL